VDVHLHKNCVMKITDGHCIMSIKIEMSKGMENGGAIEVVGLCANHEPKRHVQM